MLVSGHTPLCPPQFSSKGGCLPYNASAVILGLVPRICRRSSRWESVFCFAGSVVAAPLKVDPRDKPEDDGGVRDDDGAKGCKPR